jgi:hypothetical protein
MGSAVIVVPESSAGVVADADDSAKDALAPADVDSCAGGDPADDSAPEDIDAITPVKSSLI